MICVLVASCSASDDRRLAAIRGSKMAKLLHSGRFGLPTSLKSDRDVYLVITSQPMGDIVLLGSRLSVSQAKLSADLTEVVEGCFADKPDLEFFQDGDDSIVTAKYPARRTALGSWSDTIPVSKIISNIRDKDLIPHTVFRIHPGTRISWLGEPRYRSANFLYFVEDQLSITGDVHVSATSSIASLVIIIFALLLIPALSIWSLSVGIRMMADINRPLEQRHAMYRRFCVWGVLLLMMCYQVWVFIFFSSRHMAPGIELWIRDNPAVVLVLAEMASILFLAALLIAGWMTKRAILPFDKSKPKELGSAFLVGFAILFIVFQQVMLSLLRIARSLESP